MPVLTKQMSNILNENEPSKKSRSASKSKSKLKVKKSAISSKFEDYPDVNAKTMIYASSAPASGPGSGPPSKSKTVSITKITSKTTRSKKDTHISKVTKSTVSSASKTSSRASAQNPEEYDLRKIKFLRDNITTEVKRIWQTRGAIAPEKDFRKYQILESEGVFAESERSRVFRAKHVSYPNNIIAVKVYEFPEGTNMQAVSEALHLKILRHVGKKFPYIIATWQIYAVENRVLVYQDFANAGSMAAYLERKGPVDEAQAARWTAQIYRALDYLGNIGIAHRGVCPAICLLTSKEHILKLSGLDDAVIYWDTETQGIQHVVCIPYEAKGEVPSFQAPEVYGKPNEEEFDPVAADVWSFGATIYAALTMTYPYDWNANPAQIDSQIRANLGKPNISSDGKRLLGEMLASHVDQRCSLNSIANDQWVQRYSATS